ncbi:uncharacterized protein LOC121389396 [Gigantopelta aegis]|uniref:uncharacterized protein LOC121389396 n=1 Tax=Gigantopelta aegis TaxID=1735272 RepID=UPI001B88B428|nr:uncharacterized protein LOC121389396 [Gigantopelta aegis]
MVNYCNVLQCHNRSDRETDRSFYRIPAIIRNQGQACETLSSQRRLKWLSRLNQDFTGKNLGNVRVCSDHFIMVDLYDETNPDWAPSLKMGHEKLGFSKTSKDRHERISKRKATIKAKAAVMFPEEEFCPNEAPDDSTNTDCNVETQTDLNGFLIDAMSSELQALRLEMMDIKKHVAISKLCLSDLIGKDDKVKFLTGLSSYDVLAMLYEYLEDFIPTKKSLTKFQMLFMTLMRLRLNLSEQFLAFEFAVSQSTICRMFCEVVDVLYARTKPFVHWPEREELYKTMPMEFRKYFGKKVAVIIDCLEILIEIPSNLTARAQTWSSYKHHNTVKFLMGIRPQGTVSFISKGWGGRATDKYITEHSGFLNYILPGDIVLADRGFDIKDIMGSLCAKAKIPAFTRGKDQLSPLEIESTRKIAHCRIHVERVIGCVRQKYTMLDSTIPIRFMMTKDSESMTILDKICHVCCSLTNLCEPIVCFD